MPTARRKWYLDSLRNEYINAKNQRKGLPTQTTDEYDRLIRHATEAWEAAGLETSPHKVGEEEIDFLRFELYSHLEPMTNRRQVSIIGQYLHYFKNDIVAKMMIPWPHNSRPNARWLADEEGVRLIDAAVTPLQKMLIHLELRLLLRRCEVIRLTRHDIQFGMLNVLGKGRLGGKWRTLAWTPETLEVIQEYTAYREELISRALEIEPNQAVPDNIMIYAQYGWKLGAYRETAIDTMIKEVAIQAGIRPEDVSNHTLRRTGTRMHHHAGVPTEELSAALGHASPKQTTQYAGLAVDDLARIQPQVSSYIDQLRKEMARRPYDQQTVCRPVLISR